MIRVDGGVDQADRRQASTALHKSCGIDRPADDLAHQRTTLAAAIGGGFRLLGPVIVIEVDLSDRGKGCDPLARRLQPGATRHDETHDLGGGASGHQAEALALGNGITFFGQLGDGGLGQTDGNDFVRHAIGNGCGCATNGCWTLGLQEWKQREAGWPRRGAIP